MITPLLRRPVVLLLAAWLLIAIARIAGPSDLYDKEQPRTTSYTVDMLLNGQWILPHDTFGIPATKPPLYNWLTVPAVRAVGFTEWALKTPSLAASLATVLLLYFFGRYLAAKFPDLITPPLALVAPLLWLATPVTVKLAYVARPDMLLTACLTGAWFCATILIQATRSHPRASIGFWLCTILAALDKGPLAIFALLYLVLAALLIRRDWRVLLRSGFWWGLPLLVIVSAAWTYAARRQAPEFFQQVLLGREMADRIASPTRFFQTFLNGPAYLITRFLPWSPFVILALWHIRPKKWLRHPLAPAALWIFLWLIIFSFASTKRPDRYAPVYPAMALLAGYWLTAVLRHPRITPTCIVIAAMVVILGLCVHNQFLSAPATTHLGDNVHQFARTIRDTIHGEPLLFLDGENTPLETLLGHDQPDPPPAELAQSACWIVRAPQADDPSPPVAVSGLIDQTDGEKPGRLALYKVTPPQGLDDLRENEKTPVIFDDGSGSHKIMGTAAEAAAHWQQFWRVHRVGSTNPSH